MRFPPALAILTLSILLSVGTAHATSAQTPALSLPIDCQLGESCYVQNYVDRAPGPEARDVGCGHLTYDGHKGTDFALISRAQMEAGINVLAAAPGTVLAIRDAMPDTGLAGTPPADLAGRDCGNGVVIDHGDGWQTQYCHMRRGTISVAAGQRVTSGDVLGQVGFSGRTEFPHLHLSLRQGERVVDPFDTAPPSHCAGDTAPDLSAWTGPVAYRPFGVISIGVATSVPDYASVQAGSAGLALVPKDAPALVGWAFVFGTRAGDRMEISLIDPSGQPWFQHEEEFDRAQARTYRAAGRRVRATLLAGEWTLKVRYLRDGAEIDRAESNFTIGN